MKNLSEYLNEAVNEAREMTSAFDTDDTHCIGITDINGDSIEFDKNVVDKIYKKNKSWYKNIGFIKDMFKEFPKAVTLWYGEYDRESVIHPIEFADRDQQDKGWQVEK